MENKPRIGGRFINAFGAGVCSSFLLLAFISHNPTLFLIEAIITVGNLAIYFYKDEE